MFTRKRRRSESPVASNVQSSRTRTIPPVNVTPNSVGIAPTFTAAGASGGFAAPSKTMRPAAVAPGEVTIETPVMSVPVTVSETEPDSTRGVLPLTIMTSSEFGECCTCSR